MTGKPGVATTKTVGPRDSVRGPRDTQLCGLEAGQSEAEGIINTITLT